MTPAKNATHAIASPIFVLFLAAAGFASAQSLGVGDSTAYRACLQTAETAPDKAIEQALRWEQQGGGDGARHCAAVAYARRGDHAAAAARLEKLAWGLPEEAPKRVRAELLAQAGNAWIRARKHKSALAVLAAAVDLVPNDAAIRIDRAVALAAAGRLQDAVIDLSAALIADGNSVEALVLRASAYRRLDRLKAARADADRALFLSPRDPQALLERGDIRRLAGDPVGAAADWRRLMELHPESAFADAAQRRLADPGTR
jgi:tetratricopeptide (TPR) repeat protein